MIPFEETKNQIIFGSRRKLVENKDNKQKKKCLKLVDDFLVPMQN